MPAIQEGGTKDAVGFFVQWLRTNNMAETEAALMEEIQKAKEKEKEKQKEREKPQARPDPKVPPPVVEEKRKLPPPFESGCGDEAVVEKAAETTEEEDPDPAGVENEVDVVNFEASLAEQLKQLVDDLSKAPAVVENGTAPAEATGDVDEWTDADDLGYVRVPGRASDEYYELCEDDEHRRSVAQYIEEMDAQAETYNTWLKQQQQGGASAEGVTEDGTSGENLASGERGSPDPQAEAEDSKADGVAAKADGVAAKADGVAAKAKNDTKPVVPPTPPPMWPNTYHTTGKKPSPPQSRKHPIYEAFDLKVIYQVHRTGFEEHKDYPIRMYDIIAGRYQILEYLGSAAFSRAVQCVDLKTGHLVCVKIIRNNKDFFDQGLDEIKLLHYLNANGDPDENCVLQLYDYFYHKEHLFLVCELLRDNLYEFSKFNRESGDELYFNLPRLQKITRQVLIALRFIHNLNLIHCDLKPENILIKSYSRCEVKVIDFGSSCFTTDHLSSYVQSRCYRAPEVVLGLPYNQKVDMWSLGAILAELFSGRVLFHNDSISTMMARIVAICGPFPEFMLKRARYSNRFVTRHGVLFERNKQSGQISYLYPKKTKLRNRIGTDDPLFVDFIQQMLHLDPHRRPTAEEALQHPFLSHNYGPINPN
eukprot:EG_transcript_4722